MEESNTNTEAQADRKIYEVGFQIVPSVSEDKIGEEFSKIKDAIEKNQAIIISESTPKFCQLSYEMRKESAGKYQKYNTAYFGSVKFEASAEESLKIGEAFKINPSILRYLIIKTVRENTMTVPKIPFYRKAETQKDSNKKDEKVADKTPVSEIELDKAIDAVIAE